MSDRRRPADHYRDRRRRRRSRERTPPSDDSEDDRRARRARRSRDRDRRRRDRSPEANHRRRERTPDGDSRRRERTPDGDSRRRDCEPRRRDRSPEPQERHARRPHRSHRYSDSSSSSSSPSRSDGDETASAETAPPRVYPSYPYGYPPPQERQQTIDYYQPYCSGTGTFKNDGSFLETFKRMQEQQNMMAAAVSGQPQPETKKPAPLIGKRRGGRVLKTGLVKKPKAVDEQNAEEPPKDAWSIYMKEVRKYREAKCDEEVKTRPLVK